MAYNAASTAKNEAALSMKVHAIPVVTMRMPAIAGPTMRDALTMTLFKPTALVRSSGPTISTTKLCRAGLSTELMAPMTKASTHTILLYTSDAADDLLCV